MIMSIVLVVQVVQGHKGVSISFLSEDDAFYLPEIEKAIGKKLPLTRLDGYC